MKRNLLRFLCLLLCLLTVCLSVCAAGRAEVSGAEPDSAAGKTFTLTEQGVRDALSTSRSGVLTGSLSEQLTRAEFPEAEILDYPSIPDAIAALGAGKIAYAVVPEAQAIRVCTQETGYQYCSTPYHTDQDSFALSPDSTDLCEKINAVIRTLREDGTLTRAFEKWSGGDYSTDDIPVCTDGPVLRAALPSTKEPLSFISGNEMIGFDVEILQRIACELGMQLEVQDMTFTACLAAVSSGKADIAASVTYTEERAKQMCFTDVYYDENMVLLRAVETDSGSASWLENLRDSFTGTFLTENRWQLFVSGIGVTVLISVLAFALGTALGLVLCGMLCSRRKLLRRLAAGYGKIVSGIPILVWLMILYYMVFKGVDIPGVVVAILGFGLETGASLSGIFKTGLDSVDRGQLEAASALGFLPAAIFRRIVFPQAAAHVFDLWQGQLCSLVKSTSIVGYIAIMDLTKVSDIVRSRTFQAFFPLITTALIYFGIICLFLALLRPVQHRLNPRLRKHILKGVKTK